MSCSQATTDKCKGRGLENYVSVPNTPGVYRGGGIQAGGIIQPFPWPTEPPAFSRHGPGAVAFCFSISLWAAGACCASAHPSQKRRRRG